MLALIFEVADERYGLPAREVIEVIVRPSLRAVEGAPAWIAGLFMRGADWIPVVDLSQLLSGAPTPTVASSRVAIVTSRTRGGERLIGLLGPRMTRVLDLGDHRAAGLHVPGQEFLGAIAATDERGVQIVAIDRILPPELDRLLFGEVEGARA